MGRDGERGVKKLFMGLARGIKPLTEGEKEPDRDEIEEAYNKTRGFFSRFKRNFKEEIEKAIQEESDAFQDLVSLFQKNMMSSQGEARPSSIPIDLSISERLVKGDVLYKNIVIVDDFDGIYTKPGRNLTADTKGMGIENAMWRAGIGQDFTNVLREYIESTSPGSPKSVFTTLGIDPGRLLETEKRIALGLVEINRFSRRDAEENFYLAVMRTLYDNYRAFGTDKSPLRDDIAYALALRGIAKTHIIESMSPEPLVRLIVHPIAKALGLREIRVNGTWYRFVDGRIPLDLESVSNLVHLNYAHRKAEKHKNLVLQDPVITADQAGRIIEAAEAVLDDPSLIYVLEEYSVSSDDLVGIVDSTITATSESTIVKFHSDNPEDLAAAKRIKERNPRTRVVFYGVGIDPSKLPPVEGVEIVPVKTPLSIIEEMAAERHILADLYTIGVEGIYRVVKQVVGAQERVEKILSEKNDATSMLLAREEYERVLKEIRDIKGIERTSVYHALKEEIANLGVEKRTGRTRPVGERLRATGYLAPTQQENQEVVSQLEKVYEQLRRRGLEKPLHVLYREELPPPKGMGDLFSSIGAPLSATTPESVRESIKRTVTSGDVEKIAEDRPPEYSLALGRAARQYTPMFLVTD